MGRLTSCCLGESDRSCLRAQFQAFKKRQPTELVGYVGVVMGGLWKGYADKQMMREGELNMHACVLV